jgi:NAD(P)H-hydrate epimerase
VNLLAENKTWLAFLPPGSIFTPHMGEFRRLAGDYKDPFERMNAQREFSRKYHCYLILKGRYTFIACPDGTVIINTTGNAGMATAGAGDVLTGIITGLCAQELSPMAAAVSGVYIHGLAGDLCREIQGEQGIIAGDIIDQIPRAITSILPS